MKRRNFFKTALMAATGTLLPLPGLLAARRNPNLRRVDIYRPGQRKQADRPFSEIEVGDIIVVISCPDDLENGKRYVVEAKNRMPLDVDVDGAVWSWVIRPVEKL